jgi:hypothetical protein
MCGVAARDRQRGEGGGRSNGHCVRALFFTLFLIRCVICVSNPPCDLRRNGFGLRACFIREIAGLDGRSRASRAK